MMAKTGRPTKKTDEVVEEICRRLALGEPLATICADAHMPCFTTVWNWEDDEEFLNLSARARRHGTHNLADQCIKIADGAGDAADKRIRIDTRLRLIGKWNRKDYGDKQELDLNVNCDLAEVIASRRAKVAMMDGNAV